MRPVRGFVRRDERDDRAAAAAPASASDANTATATAAHTHTCHARRLTAVPCAGAAVGITYFRVITPLA
jgi:hypothetical protein